MLKKNKEKEPIKPVEASTVDEKIDSINNRIDDIVNLIDVYQNYENRLDHINTASKNIGGWNNTFEDIKEKLEDTRELILDVSKENIESYVDNIAKINDEYSAMYEKLVELYNTKIKDIDLRKESLITAENKLENERIELQTAKDKLVSAQDKFKLEQHAFVQKQEDFKEECDAEHEIIEKLKSKYRQSSEQKLEELQMQNDSFQSKLKADKEIICDNNYKINEQQKEINDLKSELLKYKRVASEKEIDNLNRTIEEYREQLDYYSNMPSSERIEELESKEDLLEKVTDRLRDTKKELTETQRQLSSYMMDERELENQRNISLALQALNDELLQRIKDTYQSNPESSSNKFPGLLKIDKEPIQSIDNEEFEGDLKELVEHIRNYGASSRSNPLYYSKETIAAFIASLAASEPASRLLILQGLSGTGKSSLPRLFSQALGILCYTVPVQPSWRDNRELLGYYNDFTAVFKETEFTKILYRASMPKYKDQIVFIVLDEVNLARIEYYFADFLSILEQRDVDWKVPLMSSYSTPANGNRPQFLVEYNGTANIAIHDNVWFIGTANNDDSTSLITDKVYDRAEILDMDTRENEFPPKETRKFKITLRKLKQLFTAAKSKGVCRLSKYDKDFIQLVDDIYLKKMRITFGNRMKNQLEDFVPVYVACGGKKVEAIDYFLAHKILRKVNDRYEDSVAETLESLKVEFSTSVYGEGAFKNCIEKIDTILEDNFNIKR